MSFQNIVKPRLYLNLPEYMAIKGVSIDPIFRTLPLTPQSITNVPTIAPEIEITNPYVAILGHNESSISLTGTTSTEDIINGTIGAVQTGFSIFKVDSIPTEITLQNEASSVLLGTFYDFPTSPDASLTLEYAYEGHKEITTKGGATLTNSFYSGPPNKWQLGETANSSIYGKTGRRIWSLKWSFMSDEKIFPDNAGLANEDSNSTNETLLQGDTFQRVITLLDGGRLPFIFCGDNTNDNLDSPKPDQFAIAKFDMKSYKFKMVAHNIYSISIKIKEIW